MIRGGRSFIRRIIDLSTKVTKPHWHVKLTRESRADLSWWQDALVYFHGSAPFPVDVPLPLFAYATDAKMSGAAGFFTNDWFYTNWEVDHPWVVGKHITFLELFSVLISVKRWGPPV